MKRRYRFSKYSTSLLIFHGNTEDCITKGCQQLDYRHCYLCVFINKGSISELSGNVKCSFFIKRLKDEIKYLEITV